MRRLYYFFRKCLPLMGFETRQRGGRFKGDGGYTDTRRGQAAIRAFPWSFGVHISAIPLGDATFLAMFEHPLL